MNLRDLLESEDPKHTVAKKLEAIAKTIAEARKNYDNSDMEITIPMVNTTEGVQDLDTLSPADKLAVAMNAIKTIRMTASEDAKAHEGVNVSKAIEAMLATSPTLTNLHLTQSNDYGI